MAPGLHSDTLIVDASALTQMAVGDLWGAGGVFSSSSDRVCYDESKNVRPIG
jgi:hypothetical protein